METARLCSAGLTVVPTVAASMRWGWLLLHSTLAFPYGMFIHIAIYTYDPWTCPAAPTPTDQLMATLLR